MSAFRLTGDAIDVAVLRAELADPACGGFTCFEGWVRNHNEGLAVTRLEYQAYEVLALREGARILDEARDRFGVPQLLCVHRIGALELGGIAVWVGAASAHRDEAFRACRYVIDEIKHRVPIWKKEHYVNGDSGWVNCERCAADAGAEHAHSRADAHSPADAPAHGGTHDHQHRHG
jgi:molybdopterin synthase catalytic subunit